MEAVWFMEMKNLLALADSASWRTWLEAHYASESEAWLVYYKKTAGQPSIDYESSVEEALCYGWIDSIIKKIDEDLYARKFTPRIDCEKWSETNIRRVQKLVREGRMTDEGLNKIDRKLFEKPSQSVRTKTELKIPPFILHAITSDPKANLNFAKWPPSQKRLAVLWIADAKKEETRKKRLKEVIGLLRKNQRLGMR
jgi:uncharacterized protein YdeI (YjbR/CyaY-like superfamily)